MNKYLSIITLHVNGVNAAIKTHRVVEWIRKHDPHISCLQDLPQKNRPTQTESEVLEKNVPSKWTGKKSRGSNTYIRQNGLQNKSHKKRC